MKSRSYKYRSLFRRATAALTAGVMLFISTISTAPLAAQAVPVPNLDPSQYPGEASGEREQAAADADDLSGYEQNIADMRAIWTARWEAAVDAEIQSYLSGVNHSDAFHNTAEYRSYLRAQLELQRAAAFAAWESQIDIDTAAGRQDYLAAIAEGLEVARNQRSEVEIERNAEAIEDSFDQTSFENILERLAAGERAWERRYDLEVQQGLSQFRAAEAGQYNDYRNFLANLAAAQSQFEENLASVRAAEDHVRQGLAGQLTSLDSFVSNHAVFHDENCDASYSCSPDWNNLNAAGLQIQATIATLQAQLAANAPLSSIATLMRDELIARRADAESERDVWAGRVTQDISLPNTAVPLGSLGAAATHSISELIAIRDYYNGNHSTLINQVRAWSGEPGHRSIQILSADAQGYSPAGLYPIGLPGQLTNTQELYSVAGAGAYEYRFSYLCPGGGGGLGGISFTQCTDIHSEAEARIDVSYRYVDHNAQANVNRWQGYMNDLDAMIAQWDSQYLPAAQAWETQRAQYEANYQQWLTQADQFRGQARSTYEENAALLATAKSRWMAQAADTKKAGRKTWRDSRASVAAAQQYAPEKQREIVRAAVRNIAAIEDAPDAAKLITNLNYLEGPQITSGYLSVIDNGIPDVARLAAFENGARRSLAGSGNLALTNAMQLGYERERAKIQAMTIDMITTDRYADANDTSIFLDWVLAQIEGVEADALEDLSRAEIIERIMEQVGQGDELDVDTLMRYVLRHEIDLDEKTADQIIQEEREDSTDAVWTVEERNGRLLATRTIKNGEAYYIGGDATLEEAYVAGETTQTLNIAGAGYSALPETGHLFDDWDAGAVLGSYADGLDELYDDANDQFQNIGQTMYAADQLRDNRVQQFEGSRSGLIQQAELLEEMIFSMATGGTALGAATGSVRSALMAPMTQALEDVTGIPAGAWGALLGSGGDLGYAAVSYSLSLVEDALGIPGLSNWLSQEYSKAQLRDQRRSAMRLRPEDMVGGPFVVLGNALAYSGSPQLSAAGHTLAAMSSPTYAWRNAQYHDDGQVALQAVETTAFTTLQVVSSILPGIGNATAAAVTAAYYSAKQSYLGSLHGGTTGALAGLASGAAQGALSYYTGGVGQIGFSYSFEQGFGMTGGVKLPILGGDEGDAFGLSAGVNFSYNEYEGITGYGASIGVDLGEGGEFGHIGLGSSWDAHSGDWAGGNLGYYQNFESNIHNNLGKASWNVGVGFGPTGSDLSFTGGVSTAWDGREGQYSYGHSVGTGLTYNANDTWDLSFQQSVGISDITQAGFHGIGTGVGTTFNFGDGHVTASQGITTDFEIQSLEKAALGIHTLQAELRLEAANPGTSPERLDAIRDELSELEEQLGNVTAWEEQRLAKIDELVKDDKLTPEQAEKLRENPELAHEEGPIRDALIDAGYEDPSRGDNWISQLLGSAADELEFLFGGNASDVNGWIDEETGEFHFRTCFVGGTLVQVHESTPESEEKHGRFFKEIEEIRTGNIVRAWNVITGEFEWKRVRKTFARQASEIYVLTLATGDQIETTWSHPFWVMDKGWVKAESLTAESILMTQGGVVGLVAISTRERKTEVFNLSVEDLHTYLVGPSQVVVHNQTDTYDAGLGRFIRTEIAKMFSDAPDLNMLSPTGEFIRDNPHAAARIGPFVSGSTNITTNSVRFATRIGLENTPSMGSEGTEVNAFRHALWQATITSEFGEDIATQIGDAHEPNPTAGQGLDIEGKVFQGLSGRTLADTIVDQLNNRIGRDIGSRYRGEGMQTIALATVTEYHKNGLWQAVPGPGNTFTIERVRLSPDRYIQAMATIIHLNDSGFTNAEQRARDQTPHPSWD